jgi:sulfate adenylyltransferase subunit 2
MDYRLNHLEQLESEAIHIFREVAEQFEKPVILFSGGKDSTLLVHLARRAFWPAKIPFPILHIDTGHNFQETLEFRDKFAKEYDLNLIVGLVEDSIKLGSVQDEVGPRKSRNSLQSVTLLEAIEKYGFDALLGGARRDEEKARAKERFFSHRNEFGEWDPKNQRPELWSLYNGKKKQGEHFRIFPLSNWTELDVWEYIKLKKIELPSIYFTHKREVYDRDNVIYSKEDFTELLPGEKPYQADVRFRTIGDVSCTGALLSKASTLDEVIIENLDSGLSERGTRIDDQKSETAMEDRKKQGYF